MSAPLVSLVCPTHARAAFQPWLLWNFQKQTLYDHAELLVIDSSPTPVPIADPRVRHVFVQDNHVGRKYQLGLELAEGQAVMLVGDDDYHHPEELEVLWTPLHRRGERVMTGFWESHYLDLWTGRTSRYRAPNKLPCASSALVRTSFARWSRFTKDIASDTEWFGPLVRGVRVRPETVVMLDGLITPHVMWLVHGGNMTPGLECTWDGHLLELTGKLSHEEREQLEHQLLRLRARLRKDGHL